MRWSFFHGTIVVACGSLEVDARHLLKLPLHEYESRFSESQLSSKKHESLKWPFPL